ncbi:hypothetical protein ZWY2020_030138 [Hordeum vulgare]|nr:hypothetical protein ZWY2020_030138 [Hordeum vulgare]
MAARVHHHHNQNHHPVLVSAAASPAGSEDMRLRRSPPPASAKTEGRRLRRSPPVSVEKARRQGRASRGGAAVAGTAAGTAAGCAAVCACFPFAVLEFAVLAAVRAPAALCRRTIREQLDRRCEARARRKEEMEDVVILGGDASPKSVAAAQAKHAALKAGEEEELGWCHWPVKPAVAAAEELAEAEKEVWERFYGAGGFWRSPSQREETW